MSKTDNAFALIHFGSNIKYFELELYFCIMLKKYTSQNIIYMYSVIDTPDSFVEKITPFVHKTIGFNDDGVTYNVSFESKYTSFNTLRTCDFIFAYDLLVDYKKVCIIESDLVIMGNIDSVFELNAPSILCYKCGENVLNSNLAYRTNNKKQVIEKCDESGLNGGMMLIEPSKELFNEYVESISTIAKHGCKYPNEALFEYVNREFYNLPVKYNLSHYHTLRLATYGLDPNGSDILVYHFNETDYKHLDIIKEGWLKKNLDDPKVKSKYRVRKIPILWFEEKIYEPNKDRVNKILGKVNEILDNLKTKPSVTKEIKQNKSDWVEGYSKTHNLPYWSNKKTGKSVWVKPDELSGGKKRRRTMKKKRKHSRTTK